MSIPFDVNYYGTETPIMQSVFSTDTSYKAGYIYVSTGAKSPAYRGRLRDKEALRQFLVKFIVMDRPRTERAIANFKAQAVVRKLPDVRDGVRNKRKAWISQLKKAA